MPLIDSRVEREQQYQGVANGIRNLGAIWAQAPALRAMGAQRAAMANYQNAHAGYENAAADEARARTGLIGSQTDAANMANEAKKILGDMLAKGLIRTDSEGNFIFDAQLAGPVASAVFAQGKGANDSASGLANLFKAINAPNQARLDRQNKSDIADANNKARAALTNGKNPGDVQDIDWNQHPNGIINSRGTVTLPPMTTRETVETIPASEGKPAEVEQVPASGGSWLPWKWGEGAHAAYTKTNAPAIPATNERKITTREKVPAWQNLVSALTQQIATNTPPGTNSIAPIVNQVKQAASPASTNVPARQRLPWETPPQINFDPTNTPPALQDLLQQANKALANGADYGAVTNRLASQYGITLK